MDVNTILTAMRAEAIPEAWSGLWFVHKYRLKHGQETIRQGKSVMLPAGVYTYLRVLTDSTIHKIDPGEIVMEDTPFELRTHLNFILRASGRVLITGLGLGCVIRGLQQNPKVEQIVCIENSKDVLKLVQSYMPMAKLTIIEADALEWTATNTDKFDCAWHDLFTNRDKGEPHLDMWHAQLFRNCARKVKYQGAWAFNRRLKEVLRRKGFPWMG